MEKRVVALHAVCEPELREELVAVARANDRSVAAEIRRAISEHVRQEQPAQLEREPNGETKKEVR